MKKVLCLLSIALLLFSCNEVDDFGRVLPESVSLGEVVSVSDLSYEELNELVTDENLREDMRMSGGLLIRPFSDAFSGSFDFMEIHFSDVSSNLPSPSFGDRPMSDTELTGSIPYYENAGLLDYVYLNWDTYEQLFLPGTTLYFELVLGIYNGGGWPGFVDDCTDFGTTTKYCYSDVKSYTYPDAPVISTFKTWGGDGLYADFYMEVEGDISSQVTRRGICYSTTNSLPDVDDQVESASAEYEESFYTSVYAPVPAGTYYVRAFVQGTGGDIAYSPVCQVTCDGSVDESAR